MAQRISEQVVEWLTAGGDKYTPQTTVPLWVQGRAIFGTTTEKNSNTNYDSNFFTMNGHLLVEPSYNTLTNYNQGIRINRNNQGIAAIVLGGERGSVGDTGNAVWFVGTQSTPANATTASASITNSVFTIAKGDNTAQYNSASLQIDNNGVTSGHGLGILNTAERIGVGLSLYGGAVYGMPTRGIAHAGTNEFGTHGDVTGTWATYFTVANNSNDGWIFRRGSTNIASISGTGLTTLNGGLEIKGHIAGNTGTTGRGFRSGGGYHSAYNNIVLHGDATTGTSGIAFVSDKGSTNINQPSDRAFIQWHAHGVTEFSAEATDPTLATSGEANQLIIGVGNDATDQVRLQTPSRTGLLHQIGTNGYVIPDTNNATGTVGSSSKPVYINGGAITEIDWTFNSSVDSGTANRIAYYSTATQVRSAANLVTDGNYLSNVTYLSVNNAHQTGYRFYVNGGSYFSNTITGDIMSAWHLLAGRPSNTTNFRTYFETVGNLHHDNPARTDSEISYNRWFASNSDQANYSPEKLNLPVVDQHVLSFGIDNGVAYSRHLAFDIRSQGVYIGARTNNSWQDWRQLVTINKNTAVGNSEQPVYINQAGEVIGTTWYPHAVNVGSGNTSNYPWHRVATCTTGTGQFVDRAAIIVLHSRYNGGNYGIIKVSARANATNAAININAVWIVRYGFAENDVKIAKTSNTTGTNTTIDVYVKCGTYARRIAYFWYGSNNGFSLVASNEVSDTTTTDKKTSTEVYTDANRVSYAEIVTSSDGGIVSGVSDYNNGNTIQFGYSTAGMTSTSWLACWDGYNLRALNPTNNNIGALTAHRPLGFTSDGQGSAGWGNQTGTGVTTWNDASGGSIEFRKDNPSSGKLSIKVDGRFYGNEGNKPAMLMTNANGYWGMGDPDGTDTVWVRTTNQGIIPYQSGGVMDGHQYLGTSSWYFGQSYITRMYTHQVIVQGTVPGGTTNAGEDHPRITFQENTGTQPVHLMYNDWDTYRAPAGLKVVGGTSATPAWFEVEGDLYCRHGIGVSSASSWIDGQRYNQAGWNLTDATNTGSYWPWLRQTNTGSSKWFSFGTLNTSFYWIGSSTTRTDNGYDQGMRFDVSNGCLDGMKWLRVINNSSDNSDNAMVYFQNRNSNDWATIIDITGANYGLSIVGTGTDMLRVGTNSVLRVDEQIIRCNRKIEIWPNQGNYQEGIRIHPHSGWSTIVLGGTDLTAETGTSANSWSLHSQGGNFYLTRNGSSSTTSGASLQCVSNIWYVYTSNNGYKLAIDDMHTIAVSRNTGANAFNQCGIEIRENQLVGNGQSSRDYAPKLGFHWSNRCAGFIALDSDNSFNFVNQSNDGYKVIRSGNHYIQKGSPHIYMHNTSVTKGTNPSSWIYSALEFLDNASSRLALIENGVGTAGENYLNLFVTAYTSGSTNWSGIRLYKTTANALTIYLQGNTEVSGNVTLPNRAHAFFGTLGNYDSHTSSDVGGLTWMNRSAAPSETVDANDCPTNVWWYILRNRHTNTGNNYYTDLAIPFNANTIYYKRITSGAIQNASKNNGWVGVLDELNWKTMLKNNSGAAPNNGTAAYVAYYSDATTIASAQSATNMIMPSHYYHTMYSNATTGTEVYVHFYNGSVTATNTNANFRVKNSSSFNLFRLCGAGEATWDGTQIRATNGYLASTKNSNTVTIGSQNSSFTHIYNSADIPFIFNKSILATSGNLGNTTYPWNNLYIGKANGAGIYYAGTKATLRMIRFIDNTGDTSGNGIAIGGGGQTIIGGGESANVLCGQTATNGSEIMWIGNDNSIDFYPNLQDGYNASNLVSITASRIWAGVNGNTTREAQVGVQSGSGQVYLWSAAATNGDRGLYITAHGTGGGFAIIRVNTNNYITILANDVWGAKVRLCNDWIGFYNDRQGGTRYGYIQVADGTYMYFRKENGNNGFNFNGNLVPSSNRGANLGTSDLQWNNISARAIAIRHLDASMTDTDQILYIGYGSMKGTKETRIYYSADTSARTEFFRVNSNGSYALTRLGVNGQNTSYNFYVNGSSYFNGSVIVVTELRLPTTASTNNNAIWIG